jgi:hypothetical protein
VRRLVDYLGGVDTAIALVKEKAGIPASMHVTVREVASERPSLRSLISGGLAAHAQSAVRGAIAEEVASRAGAGLAAAAGAAQVRACGTSQGHAHAACKCAAGRRVTCWTVNRRADAYIPMCMTSIWPMWPCLALNHTPGSSIAIVAAQATLLVTRTAKQ